MASLIYNSFISDALVGSIDCDTDTFKMMLVTSSYTADKDHDRRNDVTNEITGTGYTAGGAATTLTVTVDNTSDAVEITFSSVAWATATFTCRGAVIYKSRGGASSADELVCYLDFGSNKSPVAETFTVTNGIPITIQN
jgi:hypothetical protein